MFSFDCRWIRGFVRTMEQKVERTQRELDIRAELRRWDEEFPYFHHELLIRYATGFLLSGIVSIIYDSLRGNHKNTNHKPHYRR